jgi:hypothetical protein
MSIVVCLTESIRFKISSSTRNTSCIARPSASSPPCHHEVRHNRPNDSSQQHAEDCAPGRLRAVSSIVAQLWDLKNKSGRSAEHRPRVVLSVTFGRKAIWAVAKTGKLDMSRSFCVSREYTSKRHQWLSWATKARGAISTDPSEVRHSSEVRKRHAEFPHSIVRVRTFNPK